MPTEPFAVPTDPPAIGARWALHELTSAEPIPAVPDLYMPTPAALRCLAAANVVAAEDVTDPTRRVCLPGPCGELLPGGIAVVVFVQLDIDSKRELAWLTVAVRLAARLKAAGTLPPATARDTTP